MASSTTAAGDGFGEMLRRERERRGLTLDQLSSTTKVGRNHLEALEGSNYDALPGGVFRRGILRAYLASTGLEEDTWMPLFLASLARHTQGAGQAGTDEAWEQFADNVSRTRTKESENRGGRWLGVALLLVLVALAAAALWWFRLRLLPRA